MVLYSRRNKGQRAQRRSADAAKCKRQGKHYSKQPKTAHDNHDETTKRWNLKENRQWWQSKNKNFKKSLLFHVIPCYSMLFHVIPVRSQGTYSMNQFDALLWYQVSKMGCWTLLDTGEQTLHKSLLNCKDLCCFVSKHCSQGSEKCVNVPRFFQHALRKWDARHGVQAISSVKYHSDHS